MSSITTNRIRISHMLMYFSLLSCNLRNYINIIFLPFDSISFNIMIFPMKNCIMHSYFLLNYLMFSELILSYYYVVLTNYLWPLLQNSFFTNQSYFLMLLKSSLFILVATHKYGYNPDMKTIVKKLFVISC